MLEKKMTTASDYTPKGTKIEGAYENDRNAESNDLFKAILKECFGVTDVIIGHHLIYVQEEQREDGFTYQVIEEIPSADTLIFDHAIAKHIWGPTWQSKLVWLAMEPPETRDVLLRKLWNNRKQAIETRTPQQFHGDRVEARQRVNNTPFAEEIAKDDNCG
jgi:hypothetical protein